MRSLSASRLGGHTAAVATSVLAAGIDDGNLVKLTVDCGEIDALQRLVGAAVSDWENGDGEADVHEALEAARETLNAALDDAHEGELAA